MPYFLRGLHKSVLHYSFARGRFDELADNLVARLLQVPDAAREAETSVEVQGLNACNRTSHLEVAEEQPILALRLALIGVSVCHSSIV